MAKPTTILRHVWRNVADGDCTRRVLALQQFFEAEGWEHPSLQHYDHEVESVGFWRDVDVAAEE